MKPNRTLSLLFLLILSVSCRDTNGPKSIIFFETGNLTIDDKPVPYELGDCYHFQTSSELVGVPQGGTIMVSEPSDFKGSLLMYPGGMGNAYDSATIGLVKGSVLAGYKVFQIKWDSSWLIGSEKREGFVKMAVHPATVTKELIKRFGIGDKPVILFGGSGGAAQIAYMLSFYGLDNEVDVSILWGGFWMGRIDIGCLDTNPLNAHLHYSEIANKWMDPKKFIDLSYGYDYNTPGPCELGDTSFRKSFLENSIAGKGNYFFPNTEIYLLYAGNDGLGALNQGLTYYEKLISAGSPKVYMQVVDGAKHNMTRDSTSLTIFKKILLQYIQKQ
ncbi:MAG: hypothetical protein JXB49_22800 [Bacteroidales bacterium]|nr:hypothetical protein [Bacteroidales bacterium]